MITVHHLDNSRSQRILWLLEELGLPYEVKAYKRGKDMLAPPELKAVHRLGKAPVITDGALVVAETGAIIDYILTTYGHGRLMPVIGTEARFHYTYWMHHAEGTAMTPLLLKLVTSAIRNQAPWLIKPVANRIADSIDAALVAPNLKTNIDFWENTLAKSSWFAGAEFSAADIIMSFPLEAAASRAGAGTRPHISAWLEKIHARPAYQKALVRGGPYAYV
ncbi:glutathione S-transferase [Asticcacaulis taihuensis]|jgi:glutathione S-transferase|uniref:glutathione transferase n=1 Tax=Asticcacaulis taihuensis TaxID=260084 RepID=A0A1G4PCU8_9CAUL|nr:glutathione S-transferase [Asticcacaulis taihuensis]SCW30127.1 glutathione S-transferase [Asticcacaulis taihuensis]